MVVLTLVSPLQGEDVFGSVIQGWRAKRAYPWLLSLEIKDSCYFISRLRREETHPLPRGGTDKTQWF